MFSPLRNRSGRRLREPFGKAGLTVAVIALVFATVGGAIAAVGLNGKQKKEVKAIAKGLAGKQGPAGPAGPQGPVGPQGAAGKDGAPGAPGQDGAPGQSVTANHLEPGEGPPGEECEEGGTELVSASGVEVICNGEEGSQGPAGSPWTAGGTLPPGATETGAWSLVAVPNVKCEATEGTCTATAEQGGIPAASRVPLSFPVPLANAISISNVKPVKYPGKSATGSGDLENGSKLVKNCGTAQFCNAASVNSEISAAGGFIPAGTTIAKRISPTELELSASVSGISGEGKASGVALTTTPVAPPPECETAHAGTASAENPEADPGYLCVYAANEKEEGGTFMTIGKSGGFGGSPGASTAGALLTIAFSGGKEFWGTFAVTAP